MKSMKIRAGLRSAVYLFACVVLLYVVVFMPTPYIVYQPGSASEIAPMIQVEQADPAEKGTFMMTTVSARYANVALLAVSAFNKNAEIDKKAKRLGDQTEEEYAATQVFYMNSSQSFSVQAAYREAGIPYENVPEYLFVFSVPGENKGPLLPGDRILQVEGKAVTDPAALAALLGKHKVGDSVKVKLRRGDSELEENIKLVEVKNEGQKARPGLGVVIGAIQKVQASKPGREVHFTDTNVGGPSAGLMFTMEIYNRLTPGDLTRGYRVAGTGTIDGEGRVGPIGGVKHKIVAADREGAEIFFVPEGNYKEALAKAEEIGTGMKLVKVTALKDALDYMKKLPAKE